MGKSENIPENKIIRHALLIGASPLIPVLFLDEMVVGLLWRRMVTDLAKYHNIQLTKEQVNQLAIQNRPGCSSGCSTLVIYPFKEIIREILFWLEIRRGFNLASQAYYSGILLNELFQMASFDPMNALKYTRAINYAAQGINRSSVKQAFRNIFQIRKKNPRNIKKQKSDSTKKTTYKWGKKDKSLVSRLRLLLSKPARPLDGTYVNDENADKPLQNKEKKRRPFIQNLVNRVREGISRLPEDHLDFLKMRFYEGLRNEGLIQDDKSHFG
jgi:hypothetical protein